VKIKETGIEMEYGFFFLVYEDGRSLQCCLEEKEQKEEDRFLNGPKFLNQIDSENSGFDDGLSYDCNEWLIEEIGHDETLKIILDAARSDGIEII
jgi:hypothetical protein